MPRNRLAVEFWRERHWAIVQNALGLRSSVSVWWRVTSVNHRFLTWLNPLLNSQNNSLVELILRMRSEKTYRSNWPKRSIDWQKAFLQVNYYGFVRAVTQMTPIIFLPGLRNSNYVNLLNLLLFDSNAISIYLTGEKISSWLKLKKPNDHSEIVNVPCSLTLSLSVCLPVCLSVCLSLSIIQRWLSNQRKT